MTPELAALAATAMIHLAVMSWSQKGLENDIGREGNIGTREGLEFGLSERTKRLRRALANHVENTGLFVTAVVLVTMTGTSTPFTAACAWIYVAARALYVPAYAFAWVPWRTRIFSVGLITTVAMIVASFL